VIANPKAVFLTADSVLENSLTDESAKIRLREMINETLKIA
jgi:hypothetical protein